MEEQGCEGDEEEEEKYDGYGDDGDGDGDDDDDDGINDDDDDDDIPMWWSKECENGGEINIAEEQVEREESSSDHKLQTNVRGCITVEGNR